MLGLLYRRFHSHMDSGKLLELYVCLIRPVLESGAIVWDPHLAKDVELLERCQKFALRICLKDWHADYSSLLNASCLSTLQDRRRYLKLCFMFKIVHHLVFVSDLLLPNSKLHFSRFLPPHNVLIQPFAKSNSFLYSFLPATISLWNNLPLDALTSTSLPVFKRLIRNLF